MKKSILDVRKGREGASGAVPNKIVECACIGEGIVRFMKIRLQVGFLYIFAGCINSISVSHAA